MSKTYCGVVDAYPALEMKIKYLTQNEKFVLLYRKWADHKLQTIQEFGFLKEIGNYDNEDDEHCEFYDIFQEVISMVEGKLWGKHLEMISILNWTLNSYDKEKTLKSSLVIVLYNRWVD